MIFYKHKKLILDTIINITAFIAYIKTHLKFYMVLHFIINKHVFNNVNCNLH